MANAILTEDQRWLLRAMGGWAIRDCLTYPESGWDHLMQSYWGSTSRYLDGRPEFLRGGFQCGRGRIVAPAFGGEPTVVITKVVMMRFAKSLPERLVADLRATVLAPGMTDNQRLAELLDEALGFAAEPAEPDGQLALFGALA